ncbi:hypothetical protein LTR62_006151 [Meristemomyces frigidus]|uniref:Telomere replication protein EST3 n=1 Tax=Meristemomyces frigidus TaxID=1508187 RepID=A0AAN7YEV8_9PEZI|nr:hypothetical protein LTR62_006151 [Meristemomyces frigidus]
MAKPLLEWLAEFVAQELEAVLNWHRISQVNKNIKPDPDSRFSDDSSNFRSTFDSASHTHLGDSKLQLLEVVSLDKPAKILISDGACQIRASLSATARNALEAGLEEPLDLAVKNDVLSLTKATLVSTPYGPPDLRVQLVIEDLQYQYHLRKPCGSPCPIHQHELIKPFMTKIHDTRAFYYAEEIEDDDDGNAPEQESQALHTQANIGRTHQFDTQAPQTQASIEKSQQFATQAHVRKRSALPDLERDGLMIEAGVNLSLPVRATHQAPASKRKLATFTPTNGSDLLSLMDGSRVVTEAVHDGHPTTTLPPADVPVSEPESVESPAKPPDTAPAVEVTRGWPAETPTQARRPYGRRKIPADQQRLLGKGSWYPPLPGQIHAHPNVPVELLTAWNAKTSANGRAAIPKASDSGVIRENADPAQDDGVNAAWKVNMNVVQDQRDTDGNESSSIYEPSSEDEEEFSPSQWSATPTPPKKRDMLPPDSTMGSRASAHVSVSTSTPLKKRDVVPPKSTTVSRPSVQVPVITPTPAEQQDMLPPDSTTRNSPSIRVSDDTPTPSKKQKLLPVVSTIGSRLAAQVLESPRNLPIRSPEKRREVEMSTGTKKPKEGSLRMQSSAGSSPVRSVPVADGFLATSQASAGSLRSSSPRPDHSATTPYKLKFSERDLLRRDAYRSKSNASRPAPAIHNLSGNDGSRQGSKDQSNAGSARSSQSTQHALPPRPSSSAHSTVVPSSTPADPSSGAATTIQGTQYSSGELDSQVPRPLDPVRSAHREQRSDYMKNAQRRNWLETNYEYDPTSTANGWAWQDAHTRQLKNAYNAAFPQDRVNKDDMYALFAESFPLLGQTGYRTLRLRGSAQNTSSMGIPQYDGACDDRVGPSLGVIREQDIAVGPRKRMVVKAPVQDTGDAFEDFLYAWECIKPGGAFAESKEKTKRNGVGRDSYGEEKVDVLAWGIL